jgi:predicted aldo/keto reductase-like oxidoreductase
MSINTTTLPQRILGKTGQSVSLLCLGGWHINDVGDKDESVRIMHAAIDAGINFFDNAWDYHDGGSEEIMGEALSQGGRRQQVFLMSKNCARDAQGTRQHLEDSLRRLKTDYLDLWQFHEINYDNDPDWIVERGALAEALKAQQEGKVRFIGYTGHKSPEILLKMLPLHDWDTVQLPINVCDHHYRSFAALVLPELAKRNIGAIGMKSLGGGNKVNGARFIAKGVCTVQEAMRFALAQDIDTLVTGVDSMQVLLQNLAIVQNYQPMEAHEREQLLAKVKQIATDGRHEQFKSTTVYDGPYHRAQHGFD